MREGRGGGEGGEGGGGEGREGGGRGRRGEGGRRAKTVSADLEQQSHPQPTVDSEPQTIELLTVMNYGPSSH